MEWTCKQLFEGASCRLNYDWKQHLRNQQPSITERKRRALAEERQIHEQVRRPFLLGSGSALIAS